MRLKLERFVRSLSAQEKYDDDQGIWLFEDGSQCGVCTSGAILIAKRFAGTVWGYFTSENPAAEIGGEQHGYGGHDFALVSGAGSWIIGLITLQA